ncbi:MAG: response regulator [Thermoanaerobaculales bacterium]|nr:response regulator [Thermoanaerobaculales bacterium]
MASVVDGWVLIADGDPGFARVLQILLEEEGGCEARTAGSAREIIELLAAQGLPLAAICELEMTASGGHSVVSQLRRFRPELPLIATTAHPSAASQQRARDLGVRAYLSKPIDPVELLGILGDTLTANRCPARGAPSPPAPPG